MLLRREDSVLIVVDIQEVLFPKDKSVVKHFLANCGKVIQAAQQLNIPILATEQYPERLGATEAGISEILGDVQPMSKMAFSGLGDESVAAALAVLDRKQVVLIGMETQVCVLQTALEAAEQGYSPYVVRDAVASLKKADYKAGLARLAQSGVHLPTTQMALFEWLRLAGTPDFKALLPLLK